MIGNVPSITFIESFGYGSNMGAGIVGKKNNAARKLPSSLILDRTSLDVKLLFHYLFKLRIYSNHKHNF